MRYRIWRIGRWGLGLVLGIGFLACFQYIDTSKNLACSQDSDCWDKLPCVSGVCGAEPKPEPAPPEPRPEPTTPDGGNPTDQNPVEQVADVQCPVPGGSIQLCIDDSSCKSGTCGTFQIPGCTKESKACLCKVKEDCQDKEQCCTFGTQGVCSAFGCTQP